MMGPKERITAIVFAAIIVGGPALLAGAYSSPLPVASHHASTAKATPKSPRWVCTLKPDPHRHD